MSRQTIQFDDLGSSWRRHAEDGHHVPTFDELAAERMFRLKADEYNDVGLILYRMFEMVQDSSALAHTRRGNDDAGPAHGIQSLAVLSGGYKMDVAGGEDITA